MIQTKFKVVKVSQDSYGHEIILQAVTTGKENQEFFKTTPNGEISLYTTNLEAVKQMPVNQEFFVGFIPVESGE